MGTTPIMSRKTVSLLNKQIVDCQQCPRLVHHREEIARIKRRQFQDWTYWGRPVPGFGDAKARLYILGLAPAAHGANRTGRVFTGDRSGDWLYEALHRFGFANQPESTHRQDGLTLQDCYISAAVRCAPPANKPTVQEFSSCRPFLVGDLQLLPQLQIVLALGQIAFQQYFQACRELGFQLPTPLPRFSHGQSFPLPWGITLLTSYHPSQQNTFTGKLTRPMFYKVFQKARSHLRPPPSPA